MLFSLIPQTERYYFVMAKRLDDATVQRIYPYLWDKRVHANPRFRRLNAARCCRRARFFTLTVRET